MDIVKEKGEEKRRRNMKRVYVIISYVSHLLIKNVRSKTGPKSRENGLHFPGARNREKIGLELC